MDEVRTRDSHAANADIDIHCDGDAEDCPRCLPPPLRPAPAAARPVPLAVRAGLPIFVMAFVAGRRRK